MVVEKISCQSSVKGVGPKAPERVTNKIHLSSPSLSPTPQGGHSQSPSPAQIKAVAEESKGSPIVLFSLEERATRQFVKVDNKVKVPLGMQSHQRRLEARFQRVVADSAVDRWRNIETDALTIPTESNVEEDVT